MPGAELVLVGQCGHWLPVEAPEIFLSEVTAFLQRSALIPRRTSGGNQGHHRLSITCGQRELSAMRTLLNIIWFVFSGFWLWLAYMLAGVSAAC